MMPLSEKNTLTDGIIVHLLVSFPAQPDDNGVVTPPFELRQLTGNGSNTHSRAVSAPPADDLHWTLTGDVLLHR